MCFLHQIQYPRFSKRSQRCVRFGCGIEGDGDGDGDGDEDGGGGIEVLRRTSINNSR